MKLLSFCFPLEQKNKDNIIVSIGSQKSQAGKPSLTAADELNKRLSPYTFPVYLLLDNDANEDTVEMLAVDF